MDELSIRELSHEDCEQIARLFCTDDILRDELNFREGDEPTTKEVSEKYREWCKTRSAVSYAVVLNKKTTVGCLCLSRIGSQSESARIAGWIASNYRGLGHGNMAIDQVLIEAERRGVLNTRIIPVEN